ncbi:concanavalin A-like lectin/glucanase superfamily protein [Jejuia pallidilutea]|uniref:Concanavalin A-like lectin/glucanase superfamily protein n=1 Tax=Jejuia pallidilutea TaxID=504487 RepID=A0A362XC06_9FLAO|nr:LamG-like jellyroll fold domain-containing protein [Jejuia pallidilutea]PQV51751.1 concanavalin A-like lectin/glucanase superfamily protein [Jejuia pallidilutea]
MKFKLLLTLLLTYCYYLKGTSQTNAPSIQSGVTFQWSDTQTAANHSATIQSITVNGIVYLNFGLPTGYEITQLGPNGHSANRILENGVNLENTSSSSTWNASALSAFQDLNLNHYFNSSYNGRNICDDFVSESTTTAQRQTLTYGTGILATSSGIIAVTERNANNCLHLELFGIPAGGGAEQSLGETFINQTSTQFGFGGTGTGGPNGLGTPGAINPPKPNSDYWLSDRVVENKGTLGIALFYLDDIAPNGSVITKAQLTASTTDHADGKLFIFTLEDEDKDGYSDVDDLDDDNDGIKDTDESGGVDPSADHDTDGIPNSKDPDFCTLGASGYCENMDQDGDGIPNYLDLDSDNDGITDVRESGGTDANNDGVADGAIGITPTTNGIPSSAGTGTIPVNTDGDLNGSGNRYLIYDFLDIDSDDDGIPDNVEAQSTIGYMAPSGTVSIFGIDTIYGTGLTLQDTDGDGIPDYIDLDSDNDGSPDEAENGMPFPSTNQDMDADGLVNPFETTNINDPVWDVNEDIENPSSLSILPDGDGDLGSGGDLDYRDVFNANPPAIATIDFDGIDDYVVGKELMSSFNESNTNGITLMGWVKNDLSDSDTSTVFLFGEDNAIELTATGAKLEFSGRFKTSVGGSHTSKFSRANGLKQGIWRHVAVTVDFTSNNASMFIDGKWVHTRNLAYPGGHDVVGFYSEVTAQSEKFMLGRENETSASYYDGCIDEVRVFNNVFTEAEIQEIVFQEIENSGGKLKGAITPGQVCTKNWSDLKLYYPMTNIVGFTLPDESGNNNSGMLRNITSIQEQTAPMPFTTKQDGNWHDKSTWLYGDVWALPGDELSQNSSNSDEYYTWGIYHIRNSVTLTTSLSKPSYPGALEGLHALALIVDQKDWADNGDVVLTVGNETNDLQLNVSKYLNLGGTIDLLGDSQLIQTETSDLVTSSQGKILRRQEGATNPYWYNYWSSPIGTLRATSYRNNNTSANNTNNTSYNLQMLRDESGAGMRFTTDYTGNGRISTFWLYTYINGLSYYDWTKITKTTSLSPGIGYTQKGTGSPLAQQQYIFQGKPNNGTILVDVEDRGGPGSVAGTSKTEFLLGNPYPSALDIGKFIDDNEGVIKGDIQLWQQWSGNSHNLDAYNGGYAQVNKMGAVRASQFIGLEGATTGGLEGTKVPSKYLPVGQGFIVEIENDGVTPFDGTVEFNNGQRVFVKESDADGDFNNGSVFFKTQGVKGTKVSQSNTGASNTDSIQKIRLEFRSVTGPSTKRELLLGFSEHTTDGYDYGYDAEAHDASNNDLNLAMAGKHMNMQAYGAITADKVVPLHFRSSGDNSFEIEISETENIDAGQEVYLRDNLTGDYFNLMQDQPYRFTSSQGVFNNRLQLVFQDAASALSTAEASTEENYMYYDKGGNVLYVKNMSGDIAKFVLYSITGQSMMALTDVEASTLSNGIKLPEMASGTYIAVFRLDTNQVLTKKLVKN